ncbi:DUF1186 domain-containing protein [Endozoicomonas sp. SM1973]|uniref:DUF1186 domain-containing protein n=1 Tax=Spartinivicinus marinus TaxID=2994442 RepID=A0A853I831_9GAMM|nr:DUF1186 domain-containing protein [Spartinivicinus marinus]MCX4026846.1 DUF1186 domain-containing protein [Spartinivicinus marinus]NYZ66808.1 DUF1186 domain-containing protein [Spartinivicinus marinus]
MTDVVIQKELGLQDAISLLSFLGPYQREAVDKVTANREESIPLLINNLKDVLECPGHYAYEEPNFIGHIYSVMLLGHFKATEAHQLIINLFSLPENIVDNLFDDLITENLHMILFNTSGGDLSAMKKMLFNNHVYMYSRSAALDAIEFAFYKEVITREEFINITEHFFQQCCEENNSFLVSCAGYTAARAHAEHLMPQIEEANKQGLFDNQFVSMDEVRHSLTTPIEDYITKIAESFKRSQLDDPHKQMECWAFFQEEKEKYNSFKKNEKKLSTPSTKVIKQRKKSKSKQAKAARKKNRKK